MTERDLREREDGATLVTKRQQELPVSDSYLTVEHEYTELEERAEALIERYATLFHNLTYR